jgi:hypothetical protein
MKDPIQKIISRVTLRVLIFLFVLECLLRLGGMWTLFLQNYQNKKKLTNSDAYRIMCVGESTTAVGESHAYPAQLERILNQSGKDKKFKVINKGLAAVTSDKVGDGWSNTNLIWLW